MRAPYFLKTPRLFDDVPEYTPSVSKEEVQRAIRNYRAIEKAGGKPSDKLKRFADAVFDAIANNKFDHKPEPHRKDAADSEDNITLGLHAWYLREFDPQIKELSWGAERDVSPAYIAIEERLKGEWKGVLNDHEFIKYFGTSTKTLGRKIKTALEEGFYHSNDENADFVNLQVARYLCQWVGIPDNEQKETACNIVSGFKERSGLTTAISPNAIEKLWPEHTGSDWLPRT
ncbi:hypothetical protein LH51_08320 [Nitrincola sp. A-D6]|uniref:hypothetical protein n=1 Tax=Nitrincola sp. A-D6 TaxID=1545442 RepID=UPI00051F90B5|nr:hypothetical protein [Nitrincola sp. A-D6]KGK42246.1 hypothetical protein LH51_08320 [Nitrincola sp. A-D6]